MASGVEAFVDDAAVDSCIIDGEALVGTRSVSPDDDISDGSFRLSLPFKIEIFIHYFAIKFYFLFIRKLVNKEKPIKKLINPYSTLKKMLFNSVTFTYYCRF